MTASKTATPAAAAPERRHNHSLRNQAQAWFEALQAQIATLEGAETVAALFKDWKKPEDIMHAYPALVPLFLDMVWRSRKLPAFADLMRNEAGEVVEQPTEILALSQKTFDEVIVSHLMGAVRLTCVRRQNEWLGVERQRRDSPVSKMLRGIGLISPVKTDVLLADYPQKGLYETLKPFLLRRAQFALVEPLAALPTRTAALLGPVIGVLESPAIIRTMAGLKKGTMKIAIEMAEAFVQAVHNTPAPPENAEAVDLTAARGEAFSGLLSAGTHFVALATDNRQLAADAIAKFAPVMKSEMWALLTDPNVVPDAETLRRIAECPAGVAQELQALTIRVNERVSIALSEITDTRVAALATKLLREQTNADVFLSWIREETYLSAWKQLVHHLNRDTSPPPAGEPLGPNQQAAIKKICDQGARVFAEATSPQKLAA